MKQKKLVEKAMELIRDTLDRPDLPEIVRKKGSNCFSRTRRLTSKRLSMLILSGIRLPLQLETQYRMGQWSQAMRERRQNGESIDEFCSRTSARS